RGQVAHDLRLLHHRHRHPSGAQVQGQPVPAGVRRLRSPGAYELGPWVHRAMGPWVLTMTTTPIEPTPSKKYDAIVVGSGAARGMAAFTLATAGARVLLLEAGRNVDVFKEFKTMAWAYDD